MNFSSGKKIMNRTLLIRYKRCPKGCIGSKIFPETLCENTQKKYLRYGEGNEEWEKEMDKRQNNRKKLEVTSATETRSAPYSPATFLLHCMSRSAPCPYSLHTIPQHESGG